MSDEKPQNGPKQIMEFFSTKELPVSPKEFREFWTGLSDEEKAEFKDADLGE